MSIIYQSKILDNEESVEKEFTIHKGLNPNFNIEMSNSWRKKNVELLQLITNESGEDEGKLHILLNKCMMEDSHWNWIGKTYHCFGRDYEWFYLVIDGTIQACCVIYHPKESRIDMSQIFYVKYLAVAPWNRNTPFFLRKYGALGSILLGRCAEYSKCAYQYRYGFSLHSLPQALNYYVDKLKMNDYGIDITEDNLHYLEINEVNSEQLVKEYV